MDALTSSRMLPKVDADVGVMFHLQACKLSTVSDKSQATV